MNFKEKIKYNSGLYQTHHQKESEELTVNINHFENIISQPSNDVSKFGLAIGSDKFLTIEVPVDIDDKRESYRLN